MESPHTNSHTYWPLDGAVKLKTLRKLHFWAPTSGQSEWLLVSGDSKFYGASNECPFVTQICT